MADIEQVQTTPELTTPREQQVTIIDQRDMPLALKNLIDSSNETLRAVQAQLLEKITMSSDELMMMLGLTRDEGWLVDLDNQLFVQIDLPQVEVDDDNTEEETE